MRNEYARRQLQDIRHFALDLDGTVYKGGTLFDCTRPFLAQLRELGIGVTFLTNNSSKSVRDYLARLKQLGLEVCADQVFTSGLATIDYLRKHHPDFHRLFLLGTDSLKEEFSESGFTIVGDSASQEPDAIVVGFDTALCYSRLCMAGYWISKGKPYIATHPDRTCPTDQDTLLVDCGAICACLEEATGRAPDVVLGKPHPCMLEGILSRHNLQPRQLAMVGDRIMTDMEMARVSGALAILVLTGESTRDHVEQCTTPPDLVVADLGEIGRFLS